MPSLAQKIQDMLGPTGVREAKAQSIALAVRTVTGSDPQVIRKSDHTLIRLNPAQQAAARRMIDTWWKKEPSDVRVDVAPVLLPLALKKAAPFVVGIALLGFLAGRYIR